MADRRGLRQSVPGVPMPKADVSGRPPFSQAEPLKPPPTDTGWLKTEGGRGVEPPHQHAWILAGTCTFEGCEARLTSIRCDECGGSGNPDCCRDPAHRHMGSCGRCCGVGVITVVQEVER